MKVGGWEWRCEHYLMLPQYQGRLQLSIVLKNMLYISDKVGDTMEGSSIMTKIILRVVSFFFFLNVYALLFQVFQTDFFIFAWSFWEENWQCNITLKFSDLVKFHQNSLTFPGFPESGHLHTFGLPVSLSRMSV